MSGRYIYLILLSKNFLPPLKSQRPMPSKGSPHHLSPGQLTPQLCPESCSIQSTFPIILTAIHPTCKADYTIPLLQYLSKFSFVHNLLMQATPNSHSRITGLSSNFSVLLISKLLFQFTSHPFPLFFQTHRHFHTHLHACLHKIRPHTHPFTQLASIHSDSA